MLDDDAVSDAIGVILMIAVSVAAIGIITAFLLGTIRVEQVPQTDLTIMKGSSGTVHIINQRGEPLEFNRTVIRFNQQPDNVRDTFKIKKYGDTGNVSWNNTSSKNISFFDIGDVLESDNKSVKNISVIYNLSSGQTLLESVDFE